MSFDAPFVGLGAPRATLARPPSCGTSLRNRVHNHYAKTQFKSHPISILTPCHGSSCTSNFRSLFHQGTLTLLNYTYHQTHQQMVYRWSLVQSAIFIGFTRRPNYTNTCASSKTIVLAFPGVALFPALSPTPAKRPQNPSVGRLFGI